MLSIFKIWWKKYYGFMIIPFIALGFIFNNLSNFTKIAYFVFLAWILFNAIDFYRSEIKSKNDKSS
ncbi:hypothetical protein EVS87_003685 [Bacillus altitudinis]|nr:hypothetical protein EVS87_003685 [Bacillus altitudinis]